MPVIDNITNQLRFLIFLFCTLSNLFCTVHGIPLTKPKSSNMKNLDVLKLLFCLFTLLFFQNSHAEDGYKLWMRYEPITDVQQKKCLNTLMETIVIEGTSPTLGIIRDEIRRAAQGMLGKVPNFTNNSTANGSLIIGMPTTGTSGIFNTIAVKNKLNSLGLEGYFIDYITYKNKKYLVIGANTPFGALYGTFHLLRLLQSTKYKTWGPVVESPKIKQRMLNHWDNLDRTVERGYAGFSIWDWHKLPNYIDPRYIDYARANASIGINGTVLTNVNANAVVLTPEYLKKVAALANVFRPYGIKVYLTARFSAPMDIGGLSTADPLVPEVRKWWKNKIDEIYTHVPDFGGFLIKANSEGQPGPQNYGRSHADGANMFAEALAPHKGIVLWRAFVYSHEIDEDRAKQANSEFVPLDGMFLPNVVLQVKNGPIDFQPREPFHPLFGAMPKTTLAVEFQITQEYLGQDTHLAYLAPMFKETLDTDTFSPKEGATVAKIVAGSLQSVIAGVANIGTDRNWTGHPFGQVNWYAFGRLAWDHQLTSESIAEEWIGLTFGHDSSISKTLTDLMMVSRETVVNYMTPLGLHHIMGRNHHYGPGPWVNSGRPDWTSTYYHKADSLGIGFDRTASGSNALSLYSKEIEEPYSDPKTCPEPYLLWFHHLPWDYQMSSGNTLWKELCLKYDEGVRSSTRMKEAWKKTKNKIDGERYEHVLALLQIQESEAKWWRNACLLYFQQFSKLPFPTEIEQPKGDIREYAKQQFPYAPGIKPTW